MLVMAVFRTHKSNNFTTMSNHHLRNRNLSYKAKGMISVMLSLPDDWDYTVKGLIAISKEEKTAVQSILKELEDNGYLVRERIRTEAGHFDYIYNIYEEPQTEKPWTETPWTENPFTDKPCTENVPQLNTNKQNTKELNTKELNTEIKTGSLEQLYLDNCSNLRPYIPNNYSSEVTALTKSIANGMLTFEDVERAFKMANESDFLSGKVNDWQADFRWMVKPQNIQKILDGNYENRAKKKQTDMYSHDYDVDDIEKRMLRR